MPEEHAVIVRFNYGKTDLDPLFDLEHRLEEAIEDENAVEYDGHEIATDCSIGILYMYGPSGDSLLSVIKPILESTEFMHGAMITVRYGSRENGIPEHTIQLGK